MMPPLTSSSAAAASTAATAPCAATSALTSLDGKRCLITGGSRGLGRAMCLAFARAGARVAFTYSRDDRDADTTRDALRALGVEPLVFKGSVSDAAHARDVFSALAKSWGGLDALVNNAGMTQVLPIALLEEDDWDMVMRANVKGAYLFSRAALRLMIRAKRGHILNIGNFSSERVIESPVHFAAAKSALRGFTEALAREVGRYNVLVNLLSPGLLTEGLASMLPQHRVNEYLKQCPAHRLGTPDEVAAFAAFLISDLNTFITGAKLTLDGGL
jgi:3-oxoacyl-[acyl-carrier protein] reductase